MRIAAIESRQYRYQLDPPFSAAWDPEPRTYQEATIVVVRSDDGIEGYASGDALPDRDLLERLLAGRDLEPADIHGILETVDLHHGRNWTLDVAVWDLIGRTQGEPLWRLLGGSKDRISAYASSGELVSRDERVRRCLALREAGVRAVKLRLSSDWRLNLPLIEAVRDAVGSSLQIMVDANQGWRMPGDLTPRWGVSKAASFAREIERLGVYWLEEPLPADDVEGYAMLRRFVPGVLIAAGEMVRSAAEARDLVRRGLVDVIQPDVVLSGGITGARQIADLARGEGRMWSPHTWSNGYGLLANLHAALAFSTCPYLEVPFDPPAWSAKRRDWLLPVTMEIAADGTIAPPAGPGLGVVPDFEALEQYRIG